MRGIILAGGKGERLKELAPQGKAFLKVGGKTSLELIVSSLSPLFPLSIVTSSSFSFSFPAIEVKKDILPGKGPLGGLYTALRSWEEEFFFLIGCDMPFPNPGLIRYILKRRGHRLGVVPCSLRGPEPLFSLYKRDCTKTLERMIRRGKNLSFLSFLKKLKDVEFIPPEEVKIFDPSFLSFFNINTPQDREKLKEKLKKRGEGEGKKKEWPEEGWKSIP